MHYIAIELYAVTRRYNAAKSLITNSMGSTSYRMMEWGEGTSFTSVTCVQVFCRFLVWV